MTISVKDMMKELGALGKKKLASAIFKSTLKLQSTIKKAFETIGKAHKKDKHTLYATHILDIATLGFSCINGEITVAFACGTDQGIKQLWDLMNVWFHEHYEITEDGASVRELYHE